MRAVRRILFAAIFTAAAVGLAPAGLAAGQAPPRSVFLYGADKYHNSKIIDELKALNISRIFMQVKPEWLTHQHQKTRDIIGWAHESGIKVYAILLEKPDYAYDAMHLEALEEVKNLIAYCKQMKKESPEAAYDGFMVDVQPHKLFRGGDNYDREELGRRKDLMKGYVDLLRMIKKEVKASGLQLETAATVAWWYNEQGKDNILPDAKANKLARQVDMVVPLVFGGIGVSADDIIGKTEDEVSSASTMVAIGADEFASYASLLEAMEAVEKKFKLRSKFAGVAIYHYGTLLTRLSENY